MSESLIQKSYLLNLPIDKFSHIPDIPVLLFFSVIYTDVDAFTGTFPSDLIPH